MFSEMKQYHSDREPPQKLTGGEGLSHQGPKFMFLSATLFSQLWESTSSEWVALTQDHALRVQGAGEPNIQIQKSMPVIRTESVPQRRLSPAVEQHHRWTVRLPR